MVTDGSQGAQAINAAVAGAATASRAARVQVLHIAGRQHVVEPPGGGPGDPPYVVVPYVEKMQYAYAAAGGSLLVDDADLNAAGLKPL